MWIICPRCDLFAKTVRDESGLRRCRNCGLVFLTKKETRWITRWEIYAPESFIKYLRRQKDAVFGLVFPNQTVALLMQAEMNQGLFPTGKFWQWRKWMRCGKEPELLYKGKTSDGKLEYLCDECAEMRRQELKKALGIRRLPEMAEKSGKRRSRSDA